MSREAWWRISPILPVVSILAAAIAVGIRGRLSWSRHVVMLVWVVLAASAVASGARGDIPRAVVARAVAEPAVLTILCGWYFYVKPNVVEYFRAIRAEK